MTCFGLKSGQDLKNRVAHPHQEFPGVPPPQGICIFRFEIWLKIENQMLVNTDTET